MQCFHLGFMHTVIQTIKIKCCMFYTVSHTSSVSDCLCNAIVKYKTRNFVKKIKQTIRFIKVHVLSLPLYNTPNQAFFAYPDPMILGSSISKRRTLEERSRPFTHLHDVGLLWYTNLGLLRLVITVVVDLV